MTALLRILPTLGPAALFPTAALAWSLATLNQLPALRKIRAVTLQTGVDWSEFLIRRGGFQLDDLPTRDALLPEVLRRAMLRVEKGNPTSDPEPVNPSTPEEVRRHAQWTAWYGLTLEQRAALIATHLLLAHELRRLTTEMRTRIPGLGMEYTLLALVSLALFLLPPFLQVLGGSAVLLAGTFLEIRDRRLWRAYRKTLVRLPGDCDFRVAAALPAPQLLVEAMRRTQSPELRALSRLSDPSIAPDSRRLEELEERLRAGA